MIGANRTRRSKNIILCSDGTGNRVGKHRGTNVWKLYRALDRHGHKDDSDGVEQISFYDDGVGSGDFKLFKVLGGVFGWGLSRSVRDLYTFLVNNYEPGDRVYLFGFSRGAFTVRALAGMICACGVLDRNKCTSNQMLKDQVKKALKVYRKNAEKPEATQLFREEWGIFDDELAPNGHVNIKLIGVWDTVDAVGTPFDELRDWLSNFKILRYRFPNHELHEWVENGFHAVSIDDERHSFLPIMWNENNKTAHQRIEQVWFSGAHSNVGGGYPSNELSSIPLDWMMGKAEQEGLRFTTGSRVKIRNDANIYGKLYDSRAGLAAFYRYSPRDIPKICEENGIKVPRIHVSVIDRIIRGVNEYAPGNLSSILKIIPTDDEHSPFGEDKQSIEDLERDLQHSQHARSEKLGKTKVMIGARKGLYYLSLIYSISTVVTALYFVSTVSQISVEEGDGLSWLGESRRAFVTYLVPDFVLNFLDAFFAHPIFSLIVAANLVLLLDARRRLVSRMRNHCVDAWNLSQSVQEVDNEALESIKNDEFHGEGSANVG
jgi:uncharacterized protein (DUF2235 family)